MPSRSKRKTLQPEYHAVGPLWLVMSGAGVHYMVADTAEAAIAAYYGLGSIAAAREMHGNSTDVLRVEHVTLEVHLPPGVRAKADGS
jgi:hypothetical protein